MEDYDHIVENNFLTVNQNPLSTFSIDVDEASYSNVRRFINEGRLPPAGAVRIEEMINYFDYDYTPPAADEPFAVYSEIGTCPWNPKHQLIHIGLKGKELPLTNLPPSNLVFLIDVSGSMDEPNKLPLVQQSLNLLTDELREKDKVAIVVYAGNAGLVLPSTSGANKTKIKEAIDELQAGGSTAGGEGIQLAYQIARENFIPNGNNRIILATDGDFNVGMSSDDELVRLIEKERNSGVFLSVLGFGMGNYKDGKMQQLADKGNGNHSYIDNLNEAKKVLVSEFGSTLFTIAKDVKIQVEFNPGKVQAYRLIGYENRQLAAEDFKDDAKDAGELGSGHTVTALYEMIPVGVQDEFTKAVDSLKYTSIERRINNNTGEVMTIKLRYKEPTESTSKLMVHVVKEANTPFENSSDNFRFSAAVAEFGLLLRNSKFKQGAQYSQVWALANSAKGKDTNGYREEFMQLINLVSSMAKK
jgi:Ca-activated chloride channel family protein